MQIQNFSHNFYYSTVHSKSSFSGDRGVPDKTQNQHRISKTDTIISKSFENTCNSISKSYYLTAKAVEFLSPYMQNLSETVIPSTTLGCIISSIYPSLLSAVILHNNIYNHQNNLKEDAIYKTKKQCKKEMSKADFNLANSRGLFNAIYARDIASQFSASDVEELTKLNNEEFERAKKLFFIPERGEHYQLSGYSIAKCVQVPQDFLNQTRRIFKNTSLSDKTIRQFYEQYQLIEEAKSYHPLIQTEIEKILNCEHIDVVSCLALTTHNINMFTV